MEAEVQAIRCYAQKAKSLILRTDCNQTDNVRAACVESASGVVVGKFIQSKLR